MEISLFTQCTWASVSVVCYIALSDSQSCSKGSDIIYLLHFAPPLEV